MGEVVGATNARGELILRRAQDDGVLKRGWGVEAGRKGAGVAGSGGKGEIVRDPSTVPGGAGLAQDDGVGGRDCTAAGTAAATREAAAKEAVTSWSAGPNVGEGGQL
jgi:hypothetical protein